MDDAQAEASRLSPEADPLDALAEIPEPLADLVLELLEDPVECRRESLPDLLRLFPEYASLIRSWLNHAEVDS